MRKYLPYLILLALVIPAGWFLFGTGYFNMHDDLQVMRIFQMEKCFADGQIPCRWSPDMAYGFGQAMFNFYGVLPYYLGVLIRIVTPLSIIGTVKLLFFISLYASGVGMYLLAKEFWGKAGGFLSAILYVYAPYHALDIFVRGAMAESFALTFLPYLLLSFYLLVKKPSVLRLAFASVIFAGVLTTHNVSSMIYAPIAIVWTLYWLYKTKKFDRMKWVFVSGVIGAGLASFFIIPAVIEQNIIDTGQLTQEYNDYHAHFATKYQLLFDRSWDDGPSIFGPEDGMSFQIGWPHWVLGLVTMFLAFAKLRKKKGELTFLAIVLVVFAFGFSFMAHSRSVLVWERLPLISFVQFPWRFLGLVIFFLSFATGYLAILLPLKKVTVGLLVLITIVINYQYFEPVHFSRQVVDEEKLAGVAFELQQKAAILDYLPKTAEMAPQAVADDFPKIIDGVGEFFGFERGSNRFNFEAQIYESASVEIPVMFFPGWIVIVDGVEVPVNIHGAHGVIAIDMGEGRHIVQGRFTNTNIRELANSLTVVTVSALFILVIVDQRKNRNKHAKSRKE